MILYRLGGGKKKNLLALCVLKYLRLISIIIIIIIIIAFERDKIPEFLNIHSRSLYSIPWCCGCFRRMWAVPDSAISWMVSPFKFFKIFLKFLFIECGSVSSAPTMTGIVPIFPPQILYNSISLNHFSKLLIIIIIIIIFALIF